MYKFKLQTNWFILPAQLETFTAGLDVAVATTGNFNGRSIATVVKAVGFRTLEDMTAFRMRYVGNVIWEQTEKDIQWGDDGDIDF